MKELIAVRGVEHVSAADSRHRRLLDLDHCLVPFGDNITRGVIVRCGNPGAGYVCVTLEAIGKRVHLPVRK